MSSWRTGWTHNALPSELAIDETGQSVPGQQFSDITPSVICQLPESCTSVRQGQENGKVRGARCHESLTPRGRDPGRQRHTTSQFAGTGQLPSGTAARVGGRDGGPVARATLLPRRAVVDQSLMLSNAVPRSTSCPPIRRCSMRDTARRARARESSRREGPALASASA